ncbi:MAG TPA: winged helix DNA-binding domain-containing protein [Streptosporangiaceae bacterium]
MLKAQRLRAQLLTGEPAASAVAVTRRLLAVQAQDQRAARLAIRVRSRGLSATDVDHAFTAERSLVLGWLNRGTLHCVLAEDYWWLHALTTPPQSTGNVRRLSQEGVSPADAERATTIVERALTADGPLTRARLGERIAAAGVRTQGQALVHILALACRRGIAVRGPMVGGQHAYVLARDWLGAPPPASDRDRALAELARRYLVGHGPATDRDLAHWAGLPLRDARRGLSAIAGSLADRSDGLAALAPEADEMPGEADQMPRDDALPPPRLLGGYEPLLLGWASREPFVGQHGPRITVNGLFRPFALVDGCAVATWSYAGGKVSLTPFGPLSAPVSDALSREAVDVERFLTNPGRAAAQPAPAAARPAPKGPPGP